MYFISCSDIGDMKSLKSVYVDNNPYLHAVPLSINYQEIGFNRYTVATSKYFIYWKNSTLVCVHCCSCGRENFEDQEFSEFIKVTLKPGEGEKVIYFPREFQVLKSDAGGSVPSLLELAMRATYSFYKTG